MSCSSRDYLLQKKSKYFFFLLVTGIESILVFFFYVPKWFNNMFFSESHYIIWRHLCAIYNLFHLLEHIFIILRCLVSPVSQHSGGGWHHRDEGSQIDSWRTHPTLLHNGYLTPTALFNDSRDNAGYQPIPGLIN